MHDASSLMVIKHHADSAALAPLLSIKLTMPPLPNALLSRTRLLDRLAEGRASKLTLLAAPAGYGKTTLLAEWLASAKNVVWLTLDSNDNDPQRFWRYLTAALERKYPSIAAGLKPLLQMTPLPLEQIIAVVSNGLSAAANDLFVILDEYHTISNNVVQQSVSRLLDHLPLTAHLVIASRTTPALPLALLRARNQVVEITLNDLRFHDDEIRVLLNEVLQLDLSPEEHALFSERSEGWIAGIHLMVQALQSTPAIRWMPPAQQRASLLRQINGSHQFLADYFGEQVLAIQPPEIERFLLLTAVLERLSGPLCDQVIADHRLPLEALAENSDHFPAFYHDASQSVLERSDLFLVPLDNERRWFRYHRLFGEMLRDRLQRTSPDLLATLHQRAARWYEQQEQPAAAVEHVLAAGNTSWAARLMEASAHDLLMRGDMRRLRRWMSALDATHVRAHPRLLLAQAWIAVMSGDIEAATRALAEGSALAEGDIVEQARYAFECLGINAIAQVLSGNIETAERTARDAIAQLAADELFLRSVFSLVLSSVALLRGNLDEANRLFLETARVGWASGSLFITLAALHPLAEVHIQRGQLDWARKMYEHALQYSVDSYSQPLPIGGAIFIGLGDLLREQNDLHDAEQMLLNGIALGNELDGYATFAGYAALTRLYMARGDIAAARNALQQAAQLMAQGFCPPDDSLIAVLTAQLALAQGDIISASQWLGKLRTGSAHTNQHPFPCHHSHALTNRVFVQLLLAQGRADEALVLLDTLLPEAHGESVQGDLIALLALQSAAYYTIHDREAALTTLEQALRLAAPSGYVRTLLDLGAPVVTVLRAANALAREGSSLATRMPLDYIDHLLSVSPPAAPALPIVVRELEEQNNSSQGLLSARELTILRRIAAGLSTSAIANELVVAPSTIKTHIKNIFAKLEVHNRVQALARAQELHLLS